METGSGPGERGDVLKQDFALFDVSAWNVADQPVGKLPVERFGPTWGIRVNHHQGVEYNGIGVPLDLRWITHFGWRELLPRFDQQLRAIGNLQLATEVYERSNQQDALLPIEEIVTLANTNGAASISTGTMSCSVNS